MRRWIMVVIMVFLAACGAATPDSGSGGAGTSSAASSSPVSAAANATEAETVQVALDWTPNPNHTGLYVASDQGYYQQNGLDVEMVQAQEGGTVEQLVAAGRLDFGISYQEAVTVARGEGLPIVSVAAVIQHNDSGFASRPSANITSPKDWEGKKYGSFGSPVEQAVIKGLMDCAGADFTRVQLIDIGTTDFFVASERGDVDFAWIFQGIQGVQAQTNGIKLNMIMMNDLRCVPDYYTPVIITSEQLIAERPEVVRRFVTATSQGYQLAIRSPEQAADILIKAAPELDAAAVRASQTYLASRYQADAPRWGEQRAEIWRDYAQWMNERQLITTMIEPEQAFTNQFLP